MHGSCRICMCPTLWFPLINEIESTSTNMKMFCHNRERIFDQQKPRTVLSMWKQPNEMISVPLLRSEVCSMDVKWARTWRTYNNGKCTSIPYTTNRSCNRFYFIQFLAIYHVILNVEIWRSSFNQRAFKLKSMELFSPYFMGIKRSEMYRRFSFHEYGNSPSMTRRFGKIDVYTAAHEKDIEII